MSETLDLFAQLREHVAGDDDLERLVDELQLRTLRAERFMLHALVLADELVREAVDLVGASLAEP